MSQFIDEKLVEYVARLDPAADLSGNEVFPFRRELFIEDEGREGTQPNLPFWGMGRRSRWLLSGSGIAAALLVSFVFLGEARQGKEVSPAAAALLSAGGVARVEAADASEPSGSISYSRILSVVSHETIVEKPFSLWYREQIETWVAPDGSGRVRTEVLKPRWPSPRDRSRWEDFGAPDFPDFEYGQVRDRRYGIDGLAGTTHEGGPIDGGLPPSRELPADPEELHDLIYATAVDSHAPTNSRMFALASAILVQPSATPDLKAAAYEVLAEVPGIELIENAEDPSGRTGTGITLEERKGSRSTLIFDPGSAQPFAQVDEVVDAPNPIHADPVVGYMLVQESGQVDDLQSRP